MTAVTMRSTLPSESEEGEERAAGFVLFHRTDDRRRYLLLRHRDGAHWAFPKGRIEPGENERIAARREVAEETGLEPPQPIEPFRTVSAYRFKRAGRPVSKTVVYFLGETDDMDVRLSGEHTEAAWLDVAAARERLTFEESRRILGEAEAFLEAEATRR
jgi:8-oxo-dGTP pyrophosphatase MutT (NUDIX family)